MIKINHVSVYADNPFGCAEKLITMLGGYVTPFPAFRGACMYYFGNGSDGLIEFYPKTHKIVQTGTSPGFAPLRQPVNGCATHINLQVEVPLEEVAEKATKLRLTNGLRYQGFLDIWLENELLIEVTES